MATYFMLFNYTQQGVQNVKESPARIEAAKKLLRDMGAEVKASYLMMGRYDTIFIVEAPNDETAAKGALAISSKGNVRSETLRAFTEDEYKKMIGALP